MEGFDYERAKTEVKIPNGFRVEAMAAVGRPGRKESLPEKLQKRESPNDRRRLSESICEGPSRSERVSVAGSVTEKKSCGVSDPHNASGDFVL